MPVTRFTSLIFSFLLLAAFSCQQAQTPSNPQQQPFVLPPVAATGFGAYWHQGLAEVSGYTLKQARYGEMHEGDAVLVFVTEDISKSKQVKLDDPAAAGDDRLPVLKLNALKRFNTGIYTYSLMQSVFTPTAQKDFPRTVKITTSVQDWCGHVFSQLNLRNDQYALTLLSYFESEGDLQTTIPATITEDELWNKIRLDPASLPSGEQQVIPSNFYTRLKHKDIKPEKALLSNDIQGDVSVFSIEYPALQRSLKIRYESRFPHRILGWEESYPDGWGGGPVLTTIATLKGQLMTDYWARHNPDDAALRSKLGL